MPAPDPAPTPSPSAFRAWWAQRSPAAGSAVMATGIVSVALQTAGWEVLSLVLLVLACAAWLGLAAEFVLRLLRERERWVSEAESPDSLTAVAATAVLGTRVSALGHDALAGALLALAAVLWPVLLVLVVRRWRPHMPGSVFMACVATQGLAVLGATLAAAESAAWLARVALVLFWSGLVLYGLALFRFDPRQVLEGAGDHWVAGGAIAISSLAGTKLLTADSARLYLWNDDDLGVLRLTTVALLVLDLAWYAVLLAAEAVRPRPAYDTRRWATVFPLGMTAAATLSASAALEVPWLDGLGRVLLWISVAAWLAVAVGAATSARTAITSGPLSAFVRSRARR
ncbi:tellurite resistance/C4-dicarboxylate transporter family protein [Streptomyces sp. NPDC046924]|uniref:tellurite resistance/C4-dicarboxylate transporter family protein n=1 Tax=Streptomyces sp. NPDC046924 TaxID=3155136 RepID=UPI00340B2EBC